MPFSQLSEQILPHLLFIIRIKLIIMQNSIQNSILHQDPVIMPIQTQTFNFHLDSSSEEQNNIALLQFRNSLTVRVKPTYMHIQIQNNRQKNSQYQTPRQGWKPKIPSKRLFDEPRFLLSLERKKVRVINGLRDSEFERSSIDRKQFKGRDGRGSKTFRVSDYHRGSKMLVDSAPKQKTEQNNQSIDQEGSRYARTSKSPYMNFNLHHLIRERKSFIDRKHSKSLDKKQGSNIPYFQFFTSQKFNQGHQRNKPNTSAGIRGILAHKNRQFEPHEKARTSLTHRMSKINPNMSVRLSNQEH